MDAVRATPFDEVGPVVEDEQCAVPLARAPERLRGRDELVVGQILLAQLDDVDAASQRCVEQVVGDPLGDEVEARARESRAPGESVHEQDASLRRWSMQCSSAEGSSACRPRTTRSSAAWTCSCSSVIAQARARRASPRGLAPDEAFGRRSLELYPDFVDELGDVGFWQCGLLDVTTGFFSEDDASVDPRRLIDALAERVALREGVEVAQIARDSVTTATGERIDAGRVVVCAGAWSGIAGVPVRPVKGQVVRLRGELPVQHMIQSDHIYIVPRQNGEVVVGATIEECGFDDTATQAATDQLLHDAARVLPAIADLEIVDVSAGLRPAMPDNRPLIGELDHGVLVATGHYRNGILLAPATAEAIVALLSPRAAP